MTAPAALLLYCAWALALTLALVGWRIRLVRSGDFRWSGFTGGQRHGPDDYWRLNRVHANTMENMGLFAALVLAGVALGCSALAWHGLAWAVALARIVQSSVHVTSARSRAVLLRGTAFLVQQAAQVTMLVWLVTRV